MPDRLRHGSIAVALPCPALFVFFSFFFLDVQERQDILSRMNWVERCPACFLTPPHHACEKRSDKQWYAPKTERLVLLLNQHRSRAADKSKHDTAVAPSLQHQQPWQALRFVGFIRECVGAGGAGRGARVIWSVHRISLGPTGSGIV